MRPGTRIWRLANAVILMTITALVLGSFVRVGINAHRRALFPDLVQGTAHRPFVYRALVPFVVRQVSASVPEGVRVAIDRNLRDPVVGIPELRRVGLDKVDWVEFLAFLMIRRPPRSTPGAPSAALPESGSLLTRPGWALYLALFAVTTFSKETSILLVAIFAVGRFRALPSKSFALLLSAQVLIFLGIRGLLSVQFAANPGGSLTFHLLDHNIWLKPYTIAQFLGFAAIAVAIARDWASKPPFLRLCLVIIVPTLVLLTLFLGFLDEYRDYYEAYPVVLLLAAPAVAQLLGARPLRATPETGH
jgi:hypothetical protein